MMTIEFEEPLSPGFMHITCLKVYHTAARGAEGVLKMADHCGEIEFEERRSPCE
jgi:hypothetical protein